MNEIARELAAASYVNQAWEKVRGPQLDVAQRTALTASRFAEQTAGNSQPSPASGETPMGGGSMFRSAAVAEGKGRTEQEGGTRAGDALGDAPPDPLLGAGGERLEAQLKQAGLSGPEAEGKEATTPGSTPRAGSRRPSPAGAACRPALASPKRKPGATKAFPSSIVRS